MVFSFLIWVLARAKPNHFVFLNLLFNKNITKLNFYLTIAIDGRLIY